MEELTTENQEQDLDLKQLIDNVNQDTNQIELTNNETLDEVENDELLNPEMNVLNLPPRREVHSQNNQKIHFKISRPFLRLAFVCILLVIVLGITFYFNPDIMDF